MELLKLAAQYRRDEIIGFDISLNSTGYARWDGEDQEYITGVIAPKMTGKNKLDPMQRLAYIKQRTEEILKATPSLRLAVIEDYAMAVGKAKQSGLAVREAGGIIKNTLHSHGVDLLLVSPSSLKLFATGNGSADKGDKNKTQMRKAASDKFGVARKTTDEIDAFWLLQLGMYATFTNDKDRQRRERVSRVNGAIFFKSAEKVNTHDHHERAASSGNKTTVRKVCGRRTSRRRSTESRRPSRSRKL